MKDLIIRWVLIIWLWCVMNIVVAALSINRFIIQRDLTLDELLLAGLLLALIFANFIDIVKLLRKQ